MDTRTFYDRISSAYDRLADANEGACRAQGLNMLGIATGERVLEIGSGTGRALTSLAAAVGPAGGVVGLDVSSGMMAMARRGAANAARPNITFALGDARALCFRDAVFDAVFMSFTLELFELADVAVVLDEIRRVIRPTGRLAVVALAEAASSNTMTDVYQWLHRHFPHFVDCRPINVVDLLERRGFRAIAARRMSIWGLSVVSVVGVR